MQTTADLRIRRLIYTSSCQVYGSWGWPIVAPSQMPITEDIQRIILADGSALEIAKQAERDGVRSLRQSGLYKVRLGVTSLEEVLGCTNAT